MPIVSYTALTFKPEVSKSCLTFQHWLSAFEFYFGKLFVSLCTLSPPRHSIQVSFLLVHFVSCLAELIYFSRISYCLWQYISQIHSLGLSQFPMIEKKNIRIQLGAHLVLLSGTILIYFHCIRISHQIIPLFRTITSLHMIPLFRANHIK